MEEDTIFPSDTELDFSFTSCASNTSTDRTFTSSSARSSLSSFTEPRVSCAGTRRPHLKTDPHWSAIHAATNLSSDGSLHLRHLKLLRHIGSGNLGRVFLCRLKDFDGADFALKVVDRDTLNTKKLSHVQMEAHVLSSFDHPFLPTLFAHLEVSHYTCLLIDYCSDGDLHCLLRRQPENRFPVDTVRFFAAEVLVALEYLHMLGVVYRDLKPENVLRRANGHIMLSDFDLCFKAEVIPTVEKRFRPRRETTKRRFGCFKAVFRRKKTVEEVTEFVAEPTTAFSKSCVGTHEYLAPELLNGSGYGSGVDWWAFGVFVYELLYGRTPFKGRSKEDTLRNIASKPLRFMDADAQEGMAEARHLIERLLVKDPRGRLGCARGATDIKRHPFFSGIKWPLIRSYRPPDVGRSKQVTRKKKGRRWSWKGLGYSNKGSNLNLNANYNNR